MKLSGIKITNFRIFENQPIDFKPITFITGANSSGKSSVFKALMLLQENIKRNQLTKLEFTEGEHILGDFDSVQNRNATPENKDKMSFTLQYQYNKHKVEAIFIFEKNDTIGVLSEHTIKIDGSEILSLKNEKGEAKIELKLDWFIENEFEFESLFEKIFNTKIDKIPENIFEYEFKIRLENNTLFKDIASKSQINYIERKELQFQEKKQIYENEKNQELYEFEKNIIFDDLESEQKNDFLDEKRKIEDKYSIEILETETTERITEYKDFVKNKFVDRKIKNELQTFRQTEIKNIKTLILKQQLVSINNIDIQERESFKDWQKYIKSEFQLFSKKYGANLYTIENEDKGFFKFLEEFDKIDFKYLDINLNDIFRIENNIILKEIFETYFKPFINLSQNAIDFKHLPANRGKQERIITFSKNNDALETAIKNYDSTNELQTKFVNTWLEKFEIGEKLKIDFIESSSVRVYIVDKDNNETNIADLGLGISQLIPIILACASAEKNTLLLLEEPETNLHPKFQSLLAEMFVEANKKFGVQFALETHSEYLIRKVQELVANGGFIDKDNKKIEFDNTKAFIYYFGKSKVEGIDFKKDGKIDYWKFGKGFYDTDYYMDFGLLNMQAKKLFDNLKNDLEGLNEEEKIKRIGERIDHYTNVQDLSKWKKDLENLMPSFSKLNNKTKHYLASAKFFLGIFDESKKQQSIVNKIDFALVIMEYGKAVEIEIQALCSLLYPTYNFSLQNIQRQFEGTVLPPNSSLNLSLFDSKFNSFSDLLDKIKNVNNNIDLSKLGILPLTRTNEPDNDTLLGFIRSYRNASAHPNQNNIDGIWDYQTALNYEYYALEFFKLWCSHLK